MDFVLNLERITGKKDYTLRAALFSQLKSFLSKYHETQMKKLLATLDQELWKNAEVAAHRQVALSHLETFEFHETTLREEKALKTSASPMKRPCRTAVIKDQHYKVVWSVLLSMEIGQNYLICLNNFPVLANDVLGHLVNIFQVI